MPKLKISIDECSNCHAKMVLVRGYAVMAGWMMMYRCEKCGHEEAHDKTYRRLNYPEDADKPARFGLCGHDLCTCTFQTIQPEVAPVRKWEAKIDNQQGV